MARARSEEPEDPRVGSIVEELEGLRRSGVRMTYDFANAPLLSWHLGRGNFDVAMRFFESLPRLQHKDVNAALASLGFVGHGRDQNVTERMNDFGVLVDRDTATVRRWTDRGFNLIARMVLDWSAEEGHDQPTVEVELSPDHPFGVRIHVVCIAEPGTKLLRPEVHGPEGALSWLEEPLEGDDVEAPTVFSGTVAIQFSRDSDLSPMLEVFCFGNIEAQFQVELMAGVMPGHNALMSWTVKGWEVRWTAPSELSSNIVVY